METTVENIDRIERLSAQVGRVFNIEDITYGDPRQKQDFLVRYRGKLRMEDSAAAYDQLAAALQPLEVTPLFRWDDDRQVVLLVPGVIRTKRSNPWINLGLFIATLLSVILTGALYGEEVNLPSDPLQLVLVMVARGLPFAVAMLAILGAHEFGHYLAGRYHGVNVTLPYFIPMPLSPFGTMGAFINMKEPPRNRRVLLDIGIAGPLSGVVVAIPVLIIGLMLSKIDTLPLTHAPDISFQIEGNSIIYLLSKLLVFRQLLPAPASYQGLSPLLYWLRYFFTGQPFPLGGVDVMLHPVAWAGWAGLLVTALNLIPAGQLDGGHMLYVLFGRQTARRILPFIFGSLALLGFVWNGWWFWAVLIFIFSRTYAEPLDQITTLDRPRKLLAALALVIFILTFTPVPLNIF